MEVTVRFTEHAMRTLALAGGREENRRAPQEGGFCSLRAWDGCDLRQHAESRERQTQGATSIQVARRATSGQVARRNGSSREAGPKFVVESDPCGSTRPNTSGLMSSGVLDDRVLSALDERSQPIDRVQ